MEDGNLQPVENIPPKKPRRAPRRKNWQQLPYILRKHIVEEFDMRGPDSDDIIARDCMVHRITVLSAAVHQCLREVTRLREALFLAGATTAKRPPQYATTNMEIVQPKGRKTA